MKSEDNKDQNINDSGKNNQPESTGRRNALKTLATVPVLGAMAYGVYKKNQYDKLLNQNAREVFNISKTTPNVAPLAENGKQIRLGVIGYGIRGEQIMRAVGFALPEHIDKLIEGAQKNPKDTRYQDYMQQEDLNVVVNGVCDIFDTYGNDAVRACGNVKRQGVKGEQGKQPKRYRHYMELLAADDIDAVIIATPDHWHAQMAIDAAKAGKHVYLEKPFSWTVPETYDARQVIRDSGIIFQLGHQNRQTDSYVKAKEIIDKGLIGPISLIEMTTNRNDPNGAWVYNIHKDANPSTVDWKQFDGPENRIKEYTDYMMKNKLERYIGPEERDKFSLERFFRWRCWWDYSTGLSGDLLTHEYDAINQMLNVGIPHSATSSGGVYFFKDGRTVPDVLQTVFEFPDKNFSMLYSATQANERDRGKVIMGHDATIEVSSSLIVKVDKRSTQYADKIKSKMINPDVPLFTYVPGQDNLDAVTSATELYFAQRGLLYTYKGGKRYDATHLHVREWLECIRANKQPSCNIDRAFEEAITAHMGTRAYLEGRTMYWDRDKDEITRG